MCISVAWKLGNSPHPIKIDISEEKLQERYTKHMYKLCFWVCCVVHVSIDCWNKNFVISNKFGGHSGFSKFDPKLFDAVTKTKRRHILKSVLCTVSFKCYIHSPKEYQNTQAIKAQFDNSCYGSVTNCNFPSRRDKNSLIFSQVCRAYLRS